MGQPYKPYSDTLVINGDTLIFSNELKSFPIPNFTPPPTPIVKIDDYNFIRNLLDLYDSYSKECYADSNKNGAILSKDDCLILMNELNYEKINYYLNNGFKIHYTYYQPDPTFDGFIKYLNKKLKRP